MNSSPTLAAISVVGSVGCTCATHMTVSPIFAAGSFLRPAFCPTVTDERDPPCALPADARTAALDSLPTTADGLRASDGRAVGTTPDDEPRRCGGGGEEGVVEPRGETAGGRLDVRGDTGGDAPGDERVRAGGRDDNAVDADPRGDGTGEARFAGTGKPAAVTSPMGATGALPRRGDTCASVSLAGGARRASPAPALLGDAFPEARGDVAGRGVVGDAELRGDKEPGVLGSDPRDWPGGGAIGFGTGTRGCTGDALPAGVPRTSGNSFEGRAVGIAGCRALFTVVVAVVVAVAAVSGAAVRAIATRRSGFVGGSSLGSTSDGSGMRCSAAVSRDGTASVLSSASRSSYASSCMIGTRADVQYVVIIGHTSPSFSANTYQLPGSHRLVSYLKNPSNPSGRNTWPIASPSPFLYTPTHSLRASSCAAKVSGMMYLSPTLAPFGTPSLAFFCTANIGFVGSGAASPEPKPSRPIMAAPGRPQTGKTDRPAAHGLLHRRTRLAPTRSTNTCRRRSELRVKRKKLSL